MNEQVNPLPFVNQPPQPGQVQPSGPFFPTGSREKRFCAAMAVLGILLMDFILYGGFCLGFAVLSVCSVVFAAVYLLRSGCKLTPYSAVLLLLSIAIGASFVRSNDGFVKFVMLCFFLLSTNLGLCLLGGQNLRAPAGVLSLLDAFRGAFTLGLGRLPEAIRGLNMARKQAGAGNKKRGAVFAGLVVAIPILAVLIFLLTRADDAFNGLMGLLPDVDWAEPVVAVMFGLPLACVLYTRGTALRHSPKQWPKTYQPKGINSLTINTVLVAVCGVYVVYLLSQLAYFSGGFAGILPEEYTMADYARRGFFEMGWLCAINLGIIVLSVALSGGKATRTTKLLCLFVGLVTLFFVATASAKMFMYIGSYGLTRLRVLTEVIMVFLALTTICVCIWLLAPKFPYMKAVLIFALLLGAATVWADVDTVVAAYNVEAYRSGRLETVDVSHLDTLSDGAVPYIALLAEDQDPGVAAGARNILESRGSKVRVEDFRSYTIAGFIADTIAKPYYAPEDSAHIS